VDAGERGRYVALIVEVVRDYLAARYAKAPLSHTTTEVLAALHGERAVPNERLAHVLTEADLIKFGRRPVTAERARELGRAARAENVTSQGINIVLAIDLSSSMLAQDFQPQNRIEVAKDVVKKFIAARTSDRIGIVAFAAEALTQVPLTTDYPVVSSAVDNLAPGQLEDGTAIGTALATAANRLRTAPGRSKVMILLTDGENNRGAIDPRTAGKAAAAFGIKIYTIGVGTEGMAPVPVGRGLFGLRYENRPVRIDEPLLTDIANVSGGRYFRARDAAALQRIYEQIDQLEREPVQTKSYVRFTELFRWPLAVALFALTIELLLAAWRGPLP